MGRVVHLVAMKKRKEIVLQILFFQSNSFQMFGKIIPQKDHPQKRLSLKKTFPKKAHPEKKVYGDYFGSVRYIILSYNIGQLLKKSFETNFSKMFSTR